MNPWRIDLRSRGEKGAPMTEAEAAYSILQPSRESPPVADRSELPSDTHRVRRRGLRVVDGSNVAYDGAGPPAFAKLKRLIRHQREEGYELVVFVNAALRHHVTDREALESAIDRGTVLQAPAGIQADLFILDYASETGAEVVSNDMFREFWDQYPDLTKRLVKFMVLEDRIMVIPPR